MRRDLPLSVLLTGGFLLSACTTGGGAAAGPAPLPTASTPDQHFDDLQKSVSELADRLEVMSDRLQRLEAASESSPRSSSTQAAAAAERPPVAEARAVHPPAAKSPAPAAAPQTVMNPRTTAAHALGGPAIEDKYRRALSLYGQGKTAEARRAFQDVFDSDPAGELADNALYWLGETFFAAGNYSNALTYYQRVVKDYSDQNKAPDALFKSGMAYEKMGDLQLARRAFDDCITRYPYSTPATSARMELKRIKY